MATGQNNKNSDSGSKLSTGISKDQQRRLAARIMAFAHTLKEEFGFETCAPELGRQNNNNLSVTLNFVIKEPDTIVQEAIASKSDSDRARDIMLLSACNLPVDLPGRAIVFRRKTYIVTDITTRGITTIIKAVTVDTGILKRFSPEEIKRAKVLEKGTLVQTSAIYRKESIAYYQQYE